MTPFELAEPKTLTEAIGLLDPDDPTVRPIAGGTALMLMMKAGVFRPSKLVSLRAIPDLSAIAVVDGALHVGAATSLAALEHSHAARHHAPVIARTMRTLSNVRVRNVATVGGALAHADPHMDLPPVLIALGARVAVQGRSGERTIPVAELSAGYFETVLGKDELIASLIVPAQNGRCAAYLKCTTRAVHDWPALGVAVSVAAEGPAIRDATIVVSAATERPVRLPDAEKAAVGAADDAALRRVGDAAAAEAELISDAQGSAAYKRELLRVHVARALRAALGAN
ncbi:MAG: FAD binding domain-containing protein [Hyphomicrobiales bacterium]|nr:FAD binding domain-containing protein [Hyphomicrobiales bacterium]